MADENGSTGTWEEWRRHVLLELKSIRKMREDITYIREQIAALKVKSGVWGAIGAGIVVVVSMLAQRFIP